MIIQGTDFKTYIDQQRKFESQNDEERLREELGMPEALGFAHDIEKNIITPEYYKSNFELFLKDLKDIIASNGPLNLVIAANGAIPLFVQLLSFLKVSGFTDWDKINIIFSSKSHSRATGEEAYNEARSTKEKYQISQGIPNKLKPFFIDDLFEFGGASDASAEALLLEGFPLLNGFLPVIAPGFKFLTKEEKMEKPLNRYSNLVMLPHTIAFEREWLLGSGLDGDVYSHPALSLEVLTKIKVLERLLNFVAAKNQKFNLSDKTDEEAIKSAQDYVDFLRSHTIFGALTDEQLETMPIYQLLYALDSEKDVNIRMQLLESYFGKEFDRLKGPVEG